MSACARCGSFAINPGRHGRDDSDLDLCDVCYWRRRAPARRRKSARDHRSDS